MSSMCSAIKGGIRITTATTAGNDGVPCVSGSHSLKARVLRRIICRPVFDQVPMPSSGAREQERHSSPPPPVGSSQVRNGKQSSTSYQEMTGVGLGVAGGFIPNGKHA